MADDQTRTGSAWWLTPHVWLNGRCIALHVPKGTRYTVSDDGPEAVAQGEDGKIGPVIVIRWADGITPIPPAAADPQPVRDREGERRQTEQWVVVHHNALRSLRFGTFPIERLARASIKSCNCGPHSLRRTVTTTYTATEVVVDAFSPAAADPGVNES